MLVLCSSKLDDCIQNIKMKKECAYFFILFVDIFLEIGHIFMKLDTFLEIGQIWTKNCLHYLLI